MAASSIILASNGSKLTNKEFKDLETFAILFVNEFEDKYLQYFLESSYKKEKSSNTFKSTTTVASFGIATASSYVVGTRVDSAPINSLLTTVFKEVDSHRKDARKTIDAINFNPENFKDSNAFRKILIEAGIEIAKSFEYQFLNIIPSKSRLSKLITLAQHAVNRIMNYIKQDKNNLEEFEDISVSYLTKGLIKGTPKGYFGNLIPKLNWKKLSLEFERKFFDYPGVYNMRKCYIKHNSEETMKTFGCRILFDWELESDLLSNYALCYEEWNYEKKIEKSDVKNLFYYVSKQLDDSDLITLANNTCDKESKIHDLVQETNIILVKEVTPILQDTNSQVQKIKPVVDKISEYVLQQQKKTKNELDEEKKKLEKFTKYWENAKEEFNERPNGHIGYILAVATSYLPGFKIPENFILSLNINDNDRKKVSPKRMRNYLRKLHSNKIIKYEEKNDVNTIIMKNEMAALIRPELNSVQGKFYPTEVLIEVLTLIETELREEKCGVSPSAVSDLLKKCAILGIDLVKYSSLYILVIKELMKGRYLYKECIDFCLIVEGKLNQQDKKLEYKSLLLLIRFYRGECYLKLNELKKAKEILAELNLKLKDKIYINAPIWDYKNKTSKMLTTVLVCLGEKEEALTLLSELEDDIFTFFRRRDLCVQDNDYATALIQLKEADRLCDGAIDTQLKATIALDMGICYMQLKDFEEAIKVFERIGLLISNDYRRYEPKHYDDFDDILLIGDLIGKAQGLIETCYLSLSDFVKGEKPGSSNKKK